jgi:hypothetical protein
MSLQKQQDFLAKIYTDEKLRRDFLYAPDEIGGKFGLNENEIGEINEILPEEISFFAETLLWKRLREVEKFLPLTKNILGKEFPPLFREFSQNYNPQTVKKHLEDSLEFCRFLQKKESVAEIAKNCAKFERAKLEFFGLGKRLVFCRLNFDVRNHLESNSKKKTSFAVWLRVGKKVKHYFF